MAKILYKISEKQLDKQHKHCGWYFQNVNHETMIIDTTIVFGPFKTIESAQAYK